ncbi:MAG: serine/threonine protein phosphatase PrpC [Halieaceae bacterium]|jgi:serine/threonine protein phosphatase PrpC
MTVSAGGSHTGMKRDHNEDCYKSDPELGLWLVADGVGGHANGEVASAIVRDTIASEVAAGTDLTEAVLSAHKAVLQEIELREGSNMGSTVVAVTLRGDRYDIVWVGDSRAYLYDETVEQLTQDHNPVSQMLAQGILTPEQADAHPDRHVLSQSLGVANTVRVDPGHVTGKLEPGQQILLCSDGLTDELTDLEIAAKLAGHSAPDDQVNILISAALKSGGRDNVTVVMVGASNFSMQADAIPAGEPTQTMRQITPKLHSSAKHNDRKAIIVLGAMVVIALLWVLFSNP